MQETSSKVIEKVTAFPILKYLFEMMMDLYDEPTLEALKKAIKYLPGNKASSNDHWPAEIYRYADNKLL